MATEQRNAKEIVVSDSRRDRTRLVGDGLRGLADHEMNLFGIDLLHEELQKPGYFLKALVSDSAAAFFPGTTEHRTVKFAGLSYEDDYKGNALAAVITNGRIEIRNHRDFPVGRVEMIIQSLLEQSEVECLKELTIQYRGERLK